MRILRFIVDKTSIRPDPSCDFSELFPGKNPNVQAEFTFSKEWDDAVKVVAFWSMLDKEYEPQALDENACMIPMDALERASFKVQVLGKKRVNSRKTVALSTTKLVVRQTGGRR